MIEIYLIKVIEIHSILSSLGTKTKSYYLNSLCSADKINTSTELHTHKHLTLRWRAGPRNRLPLLCIHPGDQTNCIKCQVHPRAAVFQMYILHPRAVWKKLCAAGCLYLLSCEFSELYKYMCVCECVYNYFHCHTLALVDVSRNVKSLCHFVWLNALHNTAKPVIIFYQTANFF